MSRRVWVMVVTVFAVIMLSGCTVAEVGVNAYLDPALAPDPKVRLRMALTAEGRPVNPLLDREVAAKLALALSGLGQVLVPPDRADYIMFYSYGLGRPEVRTEMVPVTYGGGEEWVTAVAPDGRRIGRMVPMDDWTTYDSVTVTYHPKRLLLKLFRAVDAPAFQTAGKNDPAPAPVWSVEAVIRTYSDDIREDIDYLIVAALEKYGRDTGRQVRVDLGFRDERVRKLRKKR